MKLVRVDGVVISAAALELSVSKADRSEVLGLLGGLTGLGVGVTVWERSPRRARWWRDAAQTSSEPSPADSEAAAESIVAIGLTEADLPLRETASIYLHLGNKWATSQITPVAAPRACREYRGVGR